MVSNGGMLLPSRAAAPPGNPIPPRLPMFLQEVAEARIRAAVAEAVAEGKTAEQIGEAARWAATSTTLAVAPGLVTRTTPSKPASARVAAAASDAKLVKARAWAIAAAVVAVSGAAAEKTPQEVAALTQAAALAAGAPEAEVPEMIVAYVTDAVVQGELAAGRTAAEVGQAVWAAMDSVGPLSMAAEAYALEVVCKAVATKVWPLILIVLR